MNTESIRSAALKVQEATRPVSFSGAGLSAESGIATFRDGSDDALWSRFDPMQLASQEGFSADPVMVTDWYNSRRKTLSGASPNDAHKTLGQQKHWVHITQNVDHLLEAGGADPKSVLHLHGTLLQDHCNANCGYTEKVDLADAPGLRHCPDCDARQGSGVSNKNYLRPSVVWFGESLPEVVLNNAADAASKADLLLVIGTSAQVYPAAGLIDVARRGGADIIVVNTEPSDRLRASDVELVGQAAEVLPMIFAES